jgi:hypothetical protein
MDGKSCEFKTIKSFQNVVNFSVSLFTSRSDGLLENETRMPNIPRKLSSISFKNAVIDYWKYRIENAEKVKSENAFV